jgi:hypothetical protein
MISRRRYDLVLAIYPQTRGFAFVLFEGWLAPVDWAVYEACGADKNARCLSRIASLLALHTPDVLVLQDMSDRGTRRARRIQELNRTQQNLQMSAAHLFVHIRASEQGVMTKQKIVGAFFCGEKAR